MTIGWGSYKSGWTTVSTGVIVWFIGDSSGSLWVLSCVLHLLDSSIILSFKQTAFCFRTLSGGFTLSSVRGLLSSWSGSFSGKKRKGFLSGSLVSLFDNLEGNNGRTFDDKGQSDLRFKQAFLCNHWAWSKFFYSCHCIVDVWIL